MMKQLVVATVLLALSLNVVSACKDNRADCAGMKLYCPIAAYEKFLRTWCPKTCNFCGGPNTQPTPPTPGTGPTPPTPPTPPTQPTQPTQPPSGGCGNPQVQQSRVIAGTTATRGAWPWQILMTYNGRASCGGSLVSSNWVVTAAHCVSGKEQKPSAFKIRVGEHNRNSNEGSEVDITVSRIITHPSWSRGTMNNDIAMMKLSQPVQFTKYVQPVCLPSGNPPVGTKCYITGWGKISHPGSMTSVLQQTDLPVVSNSVCEALNRRTIPITITSAMICGGNGGATSQSGCHGDSGGPYVCNIGGSWELHGAVSHGSNDCRASKTYTVFARVNHFKSWVQQTMGT